MYRGEYSENIVEERYHWGRHRALFPQRWVRRHEGRWAVRHQPGKRAVVVSVAFIVYHDAIKFTSPMLVYFEYLLSPEQ